MHSLPEQFGFRNGERGTHTSRTIMLAELRILLESHPATATKAEYWASITEGNILGKKTGSTRRLSAQRLSELYGLDPGVTLFRLLRFFWYLEDTGRALLAENSGEISRHLVGTKIEPTSEDQQVLVADYPLLPVRRRFWERTLRAVDAAGTVGPVTYAA